MTKVVVEMSKHEPRVDHQSREEAKQEQDQLEEQNRVKPRVF